MYEPRGWVPPKRRVGSRRVANSRGHIAYPLVDRNGLLPEEQDESHLLGVDAPHGVDAQTSGMQHGKTPSF